MWELRNIARVGVFLAALALLAAQSATAAERGHGGRGHFFEKAKRVVVSVLSRFGPPPGSPEPPP